MAVQPPGCIGAIEEKSVLACGRPASRSAAMTSAWAAEGDPATPPTLMFSALEVPETETTSSQLQPIEGMTLSIVERAVLTGSRRPGAAGICDASRAVAPGAACSPGPGPLKRRQP